MDDQQIEVIAGAVESTQDLNADDIHERDGTDREQGIAHYNEVGAALLALIRLASPAAQQKMIREYYRLFSWGNE